MSLLQMLDQIRAVSTASLNAKASKKLKKRSSRASLRVKSNTRASSSKVKNVSRSSSRNAWHRKPVFCYTGVTVSKGLNKTLSKLNATYVNNYSEDVTHIVMQSEHVQGRTMKLMLALAGTCREDGSPFFVNTNFVDESLRSGQLQNRS